ncbi:MAG TPA: putative motility protein [Firmicutes bacterium]|nr:putative motility protein [Bacillota bacterium]
MKNENLYLEAQAGLLRKAMDIQAHNILTLLEKSLPPAPVNPPHLGQHIDLQA